MRYNSYIIAKAEDLSTLSKQVHTGMERGYQPIGGVSQVQDLNKTLVVQAMGRPESRVEDKLGDILQEIKNLKIERHL